MAVGTTAPAKEIARALAWLIAQPGCHAIAGARSIDQVRDNAAAMNIRLSPKDLAESKESAARFPTPSKTTLFPGIGIPEPEPQ